MLFGVSSFMQNLYTDGNRILGVNVLALNVFSFNALLKETLCRCFFCHKKLKLHSGHPVELVVGPHA